MADCTPEPSTPTSEGRAVPLGRVLVVDDESNIRSALELVLGSQGFELDCAADAVEADAYLARVRPDVILLDIRLPGRNGLEMLRAWRLQYRGVPIILMSGEASSTEAVDGLK